MLISVGAFAGPGDIGSAERKFEIVDGGHAAIAGACRLETRVCPALGGSSLCYWMRIPTEVFSIRKYYSVDENQKMIPGTERYKLVMDGGSMSIGNIMSPIRQGVFQSWDSYQATVQQTLQEKMCPEFEQQARQKLVNPQQAFITFLQKAHSEAVELERRNRELVDSLGEQIRELGANPGR